MKKKLIKTLSFIMVLVLIMPTLPACDGPEYETKETTPQLNGEYTPDDVQMANLFIVNGMVDPLPMETVLKMDESWKKSHSGSILSYASVDGNEYVFIGSRYYGIYGNKIVFLSIGGEDAIDVKSLAGKIITTYSKSNLWAYIDGEFYSLNESNQSDFFTEEELHKIADYHKQYDEYEALRMEDYHRDIFTLDTLAPLSEEKRTEIESAWFDQRGTWLLWCGERILTFDVVYDRYYGTYNGGVVIYHSSATPLKHDGELAVADQKITSDLPFEMYYYANGELVDIVDAYKNGSLSNKDIADIVEYHNAFEEKTGFTLNYNN